MVRRNYASQIIPAVRYYNDFFLLFNIKTHDSELRGQEEAQQRDH